LSLLDFGEASEFEIIATVLLSQNAFVVVLVRVLMRIGGRINPQSRTRIVRHLLSEGFFQSTICEIIKNGWIVEKSMMRF
jgi:SOS response regulatory protein OraA/RecX